MKGKTNPRGKDSKIISVNMPRELADALTALAEADQRSKSNYCRRVLEEHVRVERLKQTPGKLDAVAESSSTALTALPESISRERRPASTGNATRQ